MLKMFPAIFLTFDHSLVTWGCSSRNLILYHPTAENFNACDQFGSGPGVFAMNCSTTLTPEPVVKAIKVWALSGPVKSTTTTDNAVTKNSV